MASEHQPQLFLTPEKATVYADRLRAAAYPHAIAGHEKVGDLYAGTLRTRTHRWLVSRHGFGEA